MNINLTPELEKFVQDKVKSGLYNNASEVIREALRAAKQSEEDNLKWLRREIQKGLDDFEAGRTISLEDAEKHIKNKLRKMARTKVSRKGT